MMFNSRGFKDAAALKGGELEESLLEASQGGKLPIVIDTSPCLAQIKGSLSNSQLRFVFLFLIPANGQIISSQFKMPPNFPSWLA